MCGDHAQNASTSNPTLIQHMDHVLLDWAGAWPVVQPDVVLQLGGRVPSTRLQQVSRVVGGWQ